MDTAERIRYEIDVRDVEYIRHGDKPYFARVYKPRGKGPFLLIIDFALNGVHQSSKGYAQNHLI